ncbi:MAG TPA: response regulator, partial [Polyangiales bacterium]|nr:response regulator [Polyangiales bacterium]
ASSVPTTAEPEPAPSLGTPARRALRILVAEDNELNITLMRELLTRAGQKTSFAATGHAALELAKSGRFDLLLLDLHLPELDGFEIARAIRDHERSVGGRLPIVAVTARSSKLDHARCVAAGMDAFLTKPLDADELRDAIARVCPNGSESVIDAERVLQACASDAAVLESMGKTMRAALARQLERVSDHLGRADLANLREAAELLRAAVEVFSTQAASLARTVEHAAARAELAESIEGVAQLQSLCARLHQQSLSITLETLEPLSARERR